MTKEKEHSVRLNRTGKQYSRGNMEALNMLIWAIDSTIRDAEGEPNDYTTKSLETFQNS